VSPLPDTEVCYRAIQGRDARFDGWFVVGVTSTGIYCRPSCPARTPRRANVRFFASAAAAQGEGFRACMRCRPDAAPGSPEWDARSDLVARAMRMIGDGVVEREGVPGLARRLGYTERHLTRMVRAELGAGPLAIARARRAQTARVLIETTPLPFASVAFAAGFASIRQFNSTIREVYALSPTELRDRGRKGDEAGPGAVSLRLAYRRPHHLGAAFGFLAARAVAGVEVGDRSSYRRVLRLPSGLGRVTLTPADGHVKALLALDDLRDLGAAVARCRRILDLDADPAAVDAALSEDPVLAALVARRPGLRIPGAADGWEAAVRAVVGQGVSVAAARTVLGRMAAALGEPVEGGGDDGDRLSLAFPVPAAVADAPDDALPVPRTRRAALRALGAAVASGELSLEPGDDPARVREGLLALAGVGPWTADYVALRMRADPDAFLPTDLAARRAAARLGLPDDPAGLLARAERWRPWRGYALLHLWTHGTTTTETTMEDDR
jgi:AraC family transcriptional regulator of adaptative response / DNA-3-methyladenine glycosylase II